MREFLTDDKFIAHKILILLKLLLIVALIFFFLPLIILPFFNHACTDDYVFGLHVNELGLAEFQRFIYLKWGGRFSATFVIGLFANKGFLYSHYYLHSLLLTGLNLASVLFVISVANKYIFKARIKGKTLLLACIYLALTICSIPEPSTFLFWFSSAVTYHLPLILLQAEIALIILLLNSGRKRTKVICSICVPLLIFVINGFNELFIIIQFPLLIATYYFDTATKLTKIYRALLLFVFLVSAALVIFAPGNAIRSNLPPYKGFAIGFGVIIYHLIETCWSIFRNPLFWLCAGVAFVYGNYSKEKFQLQRWHEKLSQKKWMIPLLVVALPGIMIVGAVWGLKGGIVADRYIDTVCYFTTLLLIFYAFVAGIQVRQFFQIDLHNSKVAIFTYILIIVTLISNAYIVDACKSIIAAPVYNTIMKEREITLRQASVSKSVAVLKTYDLALSEHLQSDYANYPYTLTHILKQRPPLLFFADDLESEENYSLKMLQQFYRVDSVIVKKN